jgi:hypothetical protein
MNDAIKMIDMLVALVYDLYPDEEYEELYQVKEKLAQVEAFLIEQTGEL